MRPRGLNILNVSKTSAIVFILVGEIVNMYALYTRFTLTILAILYLPTWGFAQLPYFEEVSEQVGINCGHAYQEEILPDELRTMAPHAIGDYNNDGYPDLYIELGDTGPNLLYKNNQDGTFSEYTAAAGLPLDNAIEGAPFFCDIDNDGHQDLLLGSFYGQGVRIFKNNASAHFTEVNGPAILPVLSNIHSISAGDYDQDGDIDLYTAHWKSPNQQDQIWENTGAGTFINADASLGIFNPFGDTNFAFAGNFVDINNDRWPDLLIASDFGTSQVWLNEKGERFRHITDQSVISDENGMGTAIGDYDNDGNLDWFVSAIYDYDGVTEGNWGASGNRLYRSAGDGTFIDISEQAGILNGSWGWGASFGDFNNDGHLDIVHTNGWPRGSDQFYHDSVRLFLADQRGGFEEIAWSVGLQDTKQGRGLSVFDYDMDGDLDIFISNHHDSPSLWRNNLSGSNTHFIALGFTHLPLASVIGTRVFVFTDGTQQMRELRCGTNYNSQNPLQMHFGLSGNRIIDSLKIQWPSGHEQTHYNVEADQFLQPELNEVQEEFESYLLYPNPFSDEIHLKFPCDQHTGQIQLVLSNLQGQRISEYSSFVKEGNNCSVYWKLDASARLQLPAGVYLLQLIINNTNRKTFRIIKH